MTDFRKFDKKWQKIWEQESIYKNERKLKKFYALDMFPYPSGEGLHVGHSRGYIGSDIIARYKIMRGYGVLHPMGWDAFGLPAENFAIKNKIHPRLAVEKNIKRFKKQLAMFGFVYDWDGEINTTDPNYYKWTQWIFLKLFEKGLAYESYEPINWCPSCQTGLANEDLEGNQCERCGTVVEKKPMRQWMLKITDYAERLLSDLDALNWPESIKESQRNWIGKSEGVEIIFPIARKYKFVLLHGFTGKQTDPIYLWLKNNLEAKGHSVVIPQLTQTDSPSEEEQVSDALSATTYDENTILYGHSLGAVVAMKVVEKLNRKIMGLVLAGGFVDPRFKDHARNFENKFDWNFDTEKIIRNCGFINALHDVHDFAISDEQAKNLERTLGIVAEKVEAQMPHFDAPEEPEILKALAPSIKVFTTRPDTLFGCTYCVLAPEHPLLEHLKNNIENWDEVVRYIEQTKKKSDIERTAEGKEKTGVELKGVKAVNPANGEDVPIFIADYVLAQYGTGAIMAVPAHDGRDWDFAKKYNLPVKIVICPNYPALVCPVLKSAYIKEGFLIDSGKFNGLKSEEANKKISEWIIKNKKGFLKTTYKLRDWVFSRQRYWGEPIPIIHCEKCGVVPVPEKDLPVILPEVKNYKPTGTGESPLANIKKWVNAKCPKCGGSAKRETNTMPQWAGSSWYYIAYLIKKGKKYEWNKKKLKDWLPVDLYVGGVEHATRHLLYARFWHKFLYDIGAVFTPEPFQRLINQGLILAEDGRKMSKRWGNVINPDDLIKVYGADSLRLYEMFMGPFNQNIAWNADGIKGMRRFIVRIYKLAVQRGKIKKTNGKDSLEKLTHQTIKKVTEDIENFRFNTAISSLMILFNEIEKQPQLKIENWKLIIKLLTPFAPHLTEEIWRNIFKNKKSVHLEKWPEYNPKLIKEENFELVIQVNGKVRDKIFIKSGISQKEAEDLALKSRKIISIISGKKILKSIFIPDRLINIVVS